MNWLYFITFSENKFEKTNTPKEIDMDIGNKIRKVREIKGYSQEYMAKQMKVSQAAYSKLEKNEKIGLDKVSSIASILEIDPVQLLSFDDQNIFNNHDQKGGNAASFIWNSFSEKERELYDQRIKHLEEEIVFLRNRLESK